MVPKFLSPPFRLNQSTGSRYISLFLVVGVWILMLAFPIQAQDVQRIAAIVNDEVISGYDVEQRVDLVIFTSNLENTADIRRRLRGQILRGLIDETLQLQAAKRYSIKVRKSDLKQAYRMIESQNKLPPGGLDRYLAATGVSKAALDAQLQASISWTKLVQRRLGRKVQVGEEEVDEVLDRLKANAGKLEFKISEIFLPVDTPNQDTEVYRASMGLLKQLRKGATFSVMARQFSRGSTAAQGGEVGWVRIGQLSTSLNSAIKRLKIGEQSEPIRGIGGYYIIQLHQRRTIAPKYQNTEKLRLKQIQFVMETGSAEADFRAKEALARKVGKTVETCANVGTVSKGMQPVSVNDLGTVDLADLPPNIVTAVKDLAVGRFSVPIRNQTGVMILMVCKRKKIQAAKFNRERIANNLSNKRLSILAQRHLRDLRRSAVVELR